MRWRQLDGASNGLAVVGRRENYGDDDYDDDDDDDDDDR